jgi:hypothetical protein
MSNFTEDHEFSRHTMPHWKRYLFNQFPDIEEIIDTNNNIVDQRNQIDLRLIFPDKTINCEIKTRKPSYLKYAGEDIAVEKTGNMDLERVGSGISNNKSDLFCYAWFDSFKLVNPLIYDTQELKKWVERNNNKLRLQTTYGTEVGNGNSYKTEFYIIKCEQIKHLLFKKKGLEYFF